MTLCASLWARWLSVWKRVSVSARPSSLPAVGDFLGVAEGSAQSHPIGLLERSFWLSRLECRNDAHYTHNKPHFARSQPKANTRLVVLQILIKRISVNRRRRRPAPFLTDSPGLLLRNAEWVRSR